jgi:hypothetical protein
MSPSTSSARHFGAPADSWDPLQRIPDREERESEFSAQRVPDLGIRAAGEDGYGDMSRQSHGDLS